MASQDETSVTTELIAGAAIAVSVMGAGITDMTVINRGGADADADADADQRDVIQRLLVNATHAF